MSSLHGNVVVGQSGGPTAVINSSARGVIDEALRQREIISGVFGANRGILGILHEDLFDLGAESSDAIELLRATPAEDDVDKFGHRQLGGAARHLSKLVKQETGLKARYNRLDTCQRNAIHFASKTDSDEAYQCGRGAVRQALAGMSGKMVNLKRLGSEPYCCDPGLVDLAEVANGVKQLPKEYLNAAGTGISQAMRDYVAPLLRGEVPIRIGADGLPVFTRFVRKSLPRRLPPFAAAAK